MKLRVKLHILFLFLPLIINSQVIPKAKSKKDFSKKIQLSKSLEEDLVDTFGNKQKSWFNIWDKPSTFDKHGREVKIIQNAFKIKDTLFLDSKADTFICNYKSFTSNQIRKNVNLDSFSRSSEINNFDIKFDTAKKNLIAVEKQEWYDFTEPDTIIFKNQFGYLDEDIDVTEKSPITDLHEFYGDYNEVEAFIAECLADAKENERKFKIPVAITLSQAILESRYGKSKLYKQSFNTFSIKCGGGRCNKNHKHAIFTDDAPNETFKVYANRLASFNDHARFLLKYPRYRKCFACGDDYECWAKNLLKAEYATDSNYDVKLINLIKKYKLDKL